MGAARAPLVPPRLASSLLTLCVLGVVRINILFALRPSFYLENIHDFKNGRTRLVE